MAVATNVGAGHGIAVIWMDSLLAVHVEAIGGLSLDELEALLCVAALGELL